MNLGELESRKQSAIERLDCLNQLQVYPPRSRLNAEGWLNNFRENEVPYALALMRGLLFFNGPNLEQLFQSAITRLMPHVVSTSASPENRLEEWSHFLSSTYFTRIPGELPSESDSGFIFLRLMRDIFGVPQNHLVSPQLAFDAAKQAHELKVVFVDDFIGSGDQMREHLEYPYGSGTQATFLDLSKTNQFYSCTSIGTEKGMGAITKLCPNLIAVTQHNLGDRYNIQSQDFFAPHGLKDFPKRIHDISLRAGIPTNSVWGHGNLGLTVAFEHGVPDSTIPLFTHRTDTWLPLIASH
jgi:hypothetical protein